VKSKISKRAVVLRGHKTSVSLEEPFWQAIRKIAERRGMSAASLVTAIDDSRKGTGNLSLALRVFVIAHYRSSVGGTGEFFIGPEDNVNA
jgi:predicted DNA-binding ribbon-helix-helix protein